ncbi:MAG: acetylxylan esterase [candidate division Zixibacteria bacterium]|nr:acetylxylan esterase [candidate division Zixibacteria bacterium]
MRSLDSLVFTQGLADRQPGRLAFQALRRDDAEIWQQKLRRQLIALMGGFPHTPCPLDAETVETVTFPDYTRETVLFPSRADLSVFAYFLTPKNATAPLPVLICLPGHGRGVDDIVGIREDGAMRDAPGGYQNDFALQAVYNGVAVLAVEQLGFGHRRDKRARQAGSGASSCMPAAGAALLMGRTMAGWRVYDVIRAIDYLVGRSEVDAARIGCMDISGGGTVTFFAAAVEPRIHAAMLSGYFNTFRDSILSLPHCIDNYIPGILRYAEMPDIAGLIAPRPLFVESGVRDPIFPVEATKTAFDRAKAIYRVFDAQDRIDMEIFDDEHVFHGVQAFPFLK